MRRGEFLAYLEAQAAGYAGTFDEWEFDQYPRLQPPGFGASDLDEVCQVDKVLCLLQSTKQSHISSIVLGVCPRRSRILYSHDSLS